MSGPYLDRMDRISAAYGCNWSDESKLLLFDRFLRAEARTSARLGDRFDQFVELQAAEEAVAAAGEGPLGGTGDPD